MVADRVCVVTVCRNAVHDLGITVESVCSQTHKGIFYVVVDGGSSDGSVEFLEQNKSRIDVCISEPDDGIYDAMNKAIAYFPPDSWVIFMNAGDRFASDNLVERLDLSSIGKNFDIVVGGVEIGAPGCGRVVDVRPSGRLEMPGCHQSMFVREYLLREHRFRPEYRVAADFDFFLRATKSSGLTRVRRLPCVVAKVAPEGFSARNERVLQSDYFKLIYDNFGGAHAYYWLGKRRLKSFVRRFLAASTRGRLD